MIQGFEALFLVLQVLGGSDELLYRFNVEELMDVVVVPEEIRGNFVIQEEIVTARFGVV